VDELILMSNQNEALQRVASQLQQGFTMKDFGAFGHVLGTEVF